MRIVATSDLHMSWPEVPKCDLLLIAGDFSYRGTLEELLSFRRALSAYLQSTVGLVVFVPGNHDWIFQRDEQTARDILNNADVLIDQEIRIGGLRIYGTPWTPEFCGWAFMADRGKPMQDKLAGIPEGLDILVSHGPPRNVLDFCPGGHVGCDDLADRIAIAKPKLVICGHIHEGYGVYARDGVTYYNVAYMNGRYKPTNQPVILDL